MAAGGPQRFDHVLIIGDTYQPATVTVKDSDGVAVDITGASGEVQLREQPGGALVLEPTVTITDAAAGQLTWSSLPAATADLRPGRLDFALRVTFASGEIRTLLKGRVTVQREVVS